MLKIYNKGSGLKNRYSPVRIRLPPPGKTKRTVSKTKASGPFFASGNMAYLVSVMAK